MGVHVQAVAKKQGFEIEWKEALIGGAALDACNDPCPDATLAQMKASDSVLLAAIGKGLIESTKIVVYFGGRFQRLETP